MAFGVPRSRQKQFSTHRRFLGKVYPGNLGSRVPHYTHGMARGWESKSVEAQQTEALEKSSSVRRRLSPEEAAREREHETLRLARQRLLEQLKSSQNPRHRRLLEDALAELDKKLGDTAKRS